GAIGDFSKRHRLPVGWFPGGGRRGVDRPIVGPGRRTVITMKRCPQKGCAVQGRLVKTGVAVVDRVIVEGSTCGGNGMVGGTGKRGDKFVSDLARIGPRGVTQPGG